MIVNFKKHFIESYFRELDKDYDMSSVKEQEYLGTGGGLKLLKGKFDRVFFMTNCDILICEDYEDILNYHRGKKNIITMVCAVKNYRLPYATIEILLDGRVNRIKAKPEFPFLTIQGFT